MIANRGKISEAHQNGSDDVCAKEGFMSTWRDIPISLKLLLTNPVIIFVTLSTITEGMVVTGVATFLPKIIQNQFIQGLSWAALLAGKKPCIIKKTPRFVFDDTS